MTKVIQDLVVKDAIEMVPSSDRKGVYSGMFLRKKSSGEWRPIFNLKFLNRFVHLQSFSLISPASVRDLFPAFPCWGVLVDLKDAYFHVMIHPGSKHLLRFTWEGSVYQYKRLPFGLKSAPYIFSRMMKPVISHLQERGIRVIPYLDDWLMFHKDKDLLQKQVNWAVQTMSDLGLIISSKSVLTPTQNMVWLGVLLDMKEGYFGVPQTKQKILQNQCRLVTGLSKISVKNAQSLLGSLNFFANYIHLGRLKLRPLQMWCINQKIHQKSPSHLIDVTKEAKAALSTWIHPITLASRVIIHSHTVDEAIVTTDASKIGWGGHCGQLEASGIWTRERKKWSINALELMAVFLTLSAFQINLQNKVIMIQSDNTTTVSYIKKQGGTRSRRLLGIAQDIWNLAETNNMTLHVSHLAGKSNLRADALSRMKTTDSEWSLHPLAFKKICLRWGQPVMDLFASSINARLPRYVTIEQNALSLEWSGTELLYIFPPFVLIQQVIVKLINMARFQVIMVVPEWKSRPWFPMLMELSRHNFIPLTIPDVPPLFQEINGKVIYPENLNYRLLGVKLWR